MTTRCRPFRARLGLLLVPALALASCSLVDSGPPESSRSASPDEAPPPPCRVDGLAAGPEVLLTGADPAVVAALVAATTHRCSEAVVLAPGDDPWAAALAVAVARHRDAPLLLVDPARSSAAGTGSAGVAGTTGPGTTTASAAGSGSTATSTDSGSTGSTGSTGSAGSAGSNGTPQDIVRRELERLGPRELVSVGVDAAPFAALAATITSVSAPPDGGTSSTTGGGAHLSAPAGLALAVIRDVAAQRIVAVPVADDDARAAALAGLQPGDALLPLPDGTTEQEALARQLPPGVPVTVLASDPAAATTVVGVLGAVRPGVSTPDPATSLWSTPSAGTVWLVDPAQGSLAAVAANAAGARDEPVLPITATDLRADRERTSRVRRAAPERAVVVGDVTTDATWQLPVITSGQALPGGGFRLFEGERMVALYGHPTTAALGALGEQDLDGAVERVRRIAPAYGADGDRVLPTFEIIVTVASAEAGDFGDYSRRTSIDEIRPYVERAGREGIYVVLDLQSGRTDFLTEAKEYEELLRLPHVGLALDPEWRLLPNQVHLRQIGSVHAAEVQQVVDWLAALTREQHLPEKLLLLNQFRLDMIPDRNTLIDPPELAMVVHMDGQGPISTKDSTYQALTAGTEDRWLWGWKSFFDEDSPMASPEHILALDPVPVFVSFQ